jgi:UDPglucose 6-dehydrogenase
MRVTVIGTGYVGAVTGACLSYVGHHVTCVDVDAEKIARFERGDIPIYERGLAELLRLAASHGGIGFTTALAPAVKASQVVFIAVGTPALPTGESDLTYLESAARAAGAAMDSSRRRVVVNKSTVPVGSGNLVDALIREGVSEPGIRFGVASNPEFLREGCAVADSLYPERIVAGAEDSGTLATLRDLYAPLVEQRFDPPPFAPRPAGLLRVPVLEQPVADRVLSMLRIPRWLALAGSDDPQFSAYA